MLLIFFQVDFAPPIGYEEPKAKAKKNEENEENVSGSQGVE